MVASVSLFASRISKIEQSTLEQILSHE